MASDDAIQFEIVFPLFSYLIEPGPSPGFMQHPATDEVYVPIWSDKSLFFTFMNDQTAKDRLSVLEMKTKKELEVFLWQINGKYKEVVINPDTRKNKVQAVLTIAYILSLVAD